MRMLWLAAGVAAAGAGCTDAASAAGGPTQVAAAQTIVAFGDSLTAGKGLDDEDLSRGARADAQGCGASLFGKEPWRVR